MRKGAADRRGVHDVAQAVDCFAAYMGALPTVTGAASSSSSSSSAPPGANCDVIGAKALWLVRMLAWVRATLDDAEDLELTSSAGDTVRGWLRELQAVAEVAEDVLDEFTHEAMRLERMESDRRTAGGAGEEAAVELLEMSPPYGGVQCSPPADQLLGDISGFLFRVEMRMEEIVSRFTKIEKPEQVLKLEDREERINHETVSATARRATRSAPEEPRIVGRTEELATIKQFLLSPNAKEYRTDEHVDDDVPTLAVVGMGGLGKTTITKLAYNDDQVKQYYQLKSWVFVSEDFDVIRLSKAMLQDLGVGTGGMSELDPLHRKLVEILKGKENFLLVLDDVWEVKNLNLHTAWRLITAPLRYRSADTKIIMTTRSTKVPGMVATNLTQLSLGFLSHEHSLELFMHHAFDGRDPNLCRNLVAIGGGIVRKCGGVPLVAKALGGLLRTKEDEKQWKEILRSEAVWNAALNQGESSIIPILNLSYRHLNAPLKRCFRYCYLLPKDFGLDRDQIVRRWVAQGYIKANRNKSMEEVGQRYINDLLSMSFFQKHMRFPESLHMHDLFHDLARSVSQDECYHAVGGNEPLLIPSHVRNLSLSLTRKPVRLIVLSPEEDKSSETKFLKSFSVPYGPDPSSVTTISLPRSMYYRMGHLRVLNLAGVILSDFPGTITHLKHLRYLCFYYINELPKFVGSLYHLQTLDLRTNRRPLKAPKCILNLYKLRHLQLRRWGYIQYPVGVGRLTDLQTVPSFHVTPDPGNAQLGELKDMNNIRGKLVIKGLENLADVNEAKNACLDKKRGIWCLHLGWGEHTNLSCIDDEVLESLKPNIRLGHLEISCFRGASHPSWLRDPSFSRLGIIELERCVNWTSLPPLGHLPSLRSLLISEVRAVKYIGNVFFSGGFSQLEELTLKGMDNWLSWSGVQAGECPKLKKLSVESCPSLESLSLINLGAVEDIFVCECPKLMLSPTDSLQLSLLPHVQTIKIENICEVGGITVHLLHSSPDLYLYNVGQPEADYMLGIYSHFHQLIVLGCSNLTSLSLGSQSALVYVEINECPDLMSLSIGNQNTLKHLHVRECPQLWITSVTPQLQGLPCIQNMYIEGIHEGVSIVVDTEQSHIKLENVDQLEASVVLNRFSHMNHQLTVIRCTNWTSLPWANLHTLEYMRINKCSMSQLLHAGNLPPTLLQLVVTWCEDLTSLPLMDLTALQYLRVSECPLFQLDANQLSPSLQILCIHGSHYKIEREQCHQHQQFCRIKQIRESSKKQGGECHLYLMFRGVCDASEAANFCSRAGISIHTLEMEWDCCANLMSKSADSVSEEVLRKLFLDAYFYDIDELKEIVIRGYTGSRWDCPLWDPSLRSLSSITLQQCSKCKSLPPLSRLHHLRELYVEGAHSLEHFVHDDVMSVEGRQEIQDHIAFRRLERLELHNMSVWKEWPGVKEGDFPRLCKLVLKHCPKLKAVPHLPASLNELELEACHELTSLPPHGCHDTHESLRSLKSLVRLSLTNCPKIELSATDGPPPTLEHISFAGCPLLLAWCEEHARELEHIPNIWLDGVKVSHIKEKVASGLERKRTRCRCCLC